MSFQDHVVDANIRGLARFSYTSVTGDRKTYYRVGDTGLFSAAGNLLSGGAKTRSQRRVSASTTRSGRSYKPNQKKKTKARSSGRSSRSAPARRKSPPKTKKARSANSRSAKGRSRSGSSRRSPQSVTRSPAKKKPKSRSLTHASAKNIAKKSITAIKNSQIVKDQVNTALRKQKSGAGKLVASNSSDKKVAAIKRATLNGKNGAAQKKSLQKLITKTAENVKKDAKKIVAQDSKKAKTTKKTTKTKKPKIQGCKLKSYGSRSYTRKTKAGGRKTIHRKPYRRCAPTRKGDEVDKAMCEGWNQKTGKSRPSCARKAAAIPKRHCNYSRFGKTNRCKIGTRAQSSKCTVYKKGNRCKLTEAEKKHKRKLAYQKNRKKILAQAKKRRAVRRIVKLAKRKARSKSPTGRSKSKRT